MNKKIAFFLILLAGILWGSMGIFVRVFNAVGLMSMDIVFLRSLVTAVVLFFVILFCDKKLFFIRLKDLWCFLGTGIASIVFFSYCYFSAIKESSLAMAAILLYTAPAIVMVLSFLLFHEKFTGLKLVSLVLTFVGCGLVTGVFTNPQNINVLGVVYGLGAGFGYALYSIFSRYAIFRNYHSLTITFYTFLIATISCCFLTDVSEIKKVVFSDASISLFSLLFGLICTVAPFLLYTLGLKYVDTSKASIIASVEPVFASLIGTVFFHETLLLSSLFGIILVLGAIGLCVSEKATNNLTNN